MIYNLHLPSKLVKLIKPSKEGLISAVKGHCAQVMAIDYIVLGLLGLSLLLERRGCLAVTEGFVALRLLKWKALSPLVSFSFCFC